MDDDPIAVEQPIKYPPVRFRIKERILAVIIEEIVAGRVGGVLEGL